MWDFFCITRTQDKSNLQVGWRCMIMNGVENKSITLFLQGEPLPAGYFDAPKPYEDLQRFTN